MPETLPPTDRPSALEALAETYAGTHAPVMHLELPARVLFHADETRPNALDDVVQFAYALKSARVSGDNHAMVEAEGRLRMAIDRLDVSRPAAVRTFVDGLEAAAAICDRRSHSLIHDSHDTTAALEADKCASAIRQRATGVAA